jgi:hypothetical protein
LRRIEEIETGAPRMAQIVRLWVLSVRAQPSHDCQHLNHNVNDHVRRGRGRSRCDAGVYLKQTEETFDAVKDVDNAGLG